MCSNYYLLTPSIKTFFSVLNQIFVVARADLFVPNKKFCFVVNRSHIFTWASFTSFIFKFNESSRKSESEGNRLGDLFNGKQGYCSFSQKLLKFLRLHSLVFKMNMISSIFKWLSQFPEMFEIEGGILFGSKIFVLWSSFFSIAFFIFDFSSSLLTML